MSKATRKLQNEIGQRLKGVDEVSALTHSPAVAGHPRTPAT